MARDIFRLAYSVNMLAGMDDTAELKLYGQIVEDCPDWWKFSKEDKSASEFDKAIKEIREQGATKLLLRINSPGGVCTESVAMRTILGSAGFDEINIRIEGICASAATDIATLPGAHVSIAEGSEYMIHNPWCYTVGNANEMEHTIEHLRNIEQQARGFYMKKTGQSEEQIKQWMDAETWFTAKEAVENGFADELLELEVGKSSAAAACATTKELDAMHALYRSVPKQIAVVDDPKNKAVSNGTPVAGEPTEINKIKQMEEDHMEIGEITIDQLKEGNPALYNQVSQSAIEAERIRMADIDAMTVPGYEEMAEQAKADGTSVVDFNKNLVAAMKKKGKDFMVSRQAETTPAKQVAGGEPGDGQKTPEQMIKDNANDIVAYAKQYAGSNGDSMY